MWQAVLVRAIQDALWVEVAPIDKQTGKVAWFGTSYARRTANHMRDEAIFWLLTDSPDFAWVCDAAGVAPTTVRKGVQRMLEASHEQKAKWYQDGFPLSGLWGSRDARVECVDP
jgi:hypothetical protein